MIGWSSCVMSKLMVANVFKVHYYERYVNTSLGGKLASRNLNLESVS